MTPAERRSYLDRLGLVDWRLRRVDTPEVVEQAQDPEKTEGDNHLTEPGPGAEPSVAAGQPSTEPSFDANDAAMQPPDGGSPANLDWAGLEAWLNNQDWRGAQRPVFGTGRQDADLLIIGEAPGAQEDRQGLPFVGPAGQLLDRMLATIGCSRQHNVYITNICKFRPPGNRDPDADEIAADWPVLERQIELMNPGMVVAVGRVSAQTLLGRTDSLGSMRGQVHQYPRRNLPVVVTYHPAYLLRTPQAKAKSWVDLKRIAGMLEDTRKAVS